MDFTQKLVSYSSVSRDSGQLLLVTFLANLPVPCWLRVGFLCERQKGRQKQSSKVKTFSYEGKTLGGRRMDKECTLDYQSVGG